MQDFEMRFEDYMRSQKLMYFCVIVFDEHGVYIDEFDNYDLKNYTLDYVGRYADFVVTDQQLAFKKNKGYTISTTILHIQKV